MMLCCAVNWNGTGNPSNIHLNDGTNGTPGITDPAGNTVAPITDWHQINPSIPAGTNIVPIARIIGSGARDAVGDFVGVDKNNAEQATIFYDNTSREDSNGDLSAKITSTPWSIGYVGIGYATTIAGNGANVLTVNGIKATAQNVCTTDLHPTISFFPDIFIYFKTFLRPTPRLWQMK